MAYRQVTSPTSHDQRTSHTRDLLIQDKPTMWQKSQQSNNSWSGHFKYTSVPRRPVSFWRRQGTTVNEMHLLKSQVLTILMFTENGHLKEHMDLSTIGVPPLCIAWDQTTISNWSWMAWKPRIYPGILWITWPKNSRIPPMFPRCLQRELHTTGRRRKTTQTWDRSTNNLCSAVQIPWAENKSLAHLRWWHILQDMETESCQLFTPSLILAQLVQDWTEHFLI